MKLAFPCTTNIYYLNKNTEVGNTANSGHELGNIASNTISK